MGLSSNQARFLAITGRKCDIEYRMQNICQRRLQLANESQRTSQLYNDAMSNRKLFINTISSGSQFGGLTSGEDLSTVAPLSVDAFLNSGYYITSEGQVLSAADDITAEELEAGLRDGSYKLARDADTWTQNPQSVTVGEGGSSSQKSVEFVDWRTVSIISDELDDSDDAEAQQSYESTIHNINEQDKILEMEMQKLNTEYTAINAERDSLTKILDTNTKSSFKYFS